MDEKCSISRVVLEDLCQQAGVHCDWNNGDPILTRDLLASGKRLSGVPDTALTGAGVIRGPVPRVGDLTLEDVKAAKELLDWNPSKAYVVETISGTDRKSKFTTQITNMTRAMLISKSEATRRLHANDNV